MSSGNPFLRDVETYKQNIDPVKHYVQQAAYYLHKRSNKPMEQCVEYVVNSIKNKTFDTIANPKVTFFERQNNGDVEVAEATLTNYIQSAKNQNLVIAPSFTCYLHPSVKVSEYDPYVDINTKARSVAKKIAQAAKAKGDKDKYIMFNNEQGYRKTTNNSLSGSYVAGGCVLNNPSAHSTLTSITRCVSSYSNASNERIISGNRHYWSYDVATNNITSICSLTDLKKLDTVIKKYGLTYPSNMAVYNCVKYSLNNYVQDPRKDAVLLDYINKLSPVECAAVVYTGDFYHLRVHNEAFVREFLEKLTNRVYHQIKINPNDIHKLDEQILNAAHQICYALLKGNGKDYEKMSDETIAAIYGTALNIENVITQYKDLIEVIFLSDNVPCTVAYIPNMIRRVVVMSDTDSTCFSVDEWVMWRYNEFKINPDTLAFGAGIMYIATQCMAHNLAIFSANMNVERKKIFLLACKPEFVWSSFMLTSVAKHYSASTIVCEGNVYKEPESEIKGVHLKSSNTPPAIIEDAHAMMNEIHAKIRNNEKVAVKDAIKRVIAVEKEITRSLLAGELTYYRLAKIKEVAAYAEGPERSPYQHHTFWNSTFGKFYGNFEEPTYAVIKVPTFLDSKTSIRNWLDNMQNQSLKLTLEAVLTERAKTAYNTMYLSSNFIAAYGMPDEIKPIIDTKRLVLDITNVYRMVLESLGICVKSGYLVSEMGYI